MVFLHQLKARGKHTSGLKCTGYFIGAENVHVAKQARISNASQYMYLYIPAGDVLTLCHMQYMQMSSMYTCKYLRTCTFFATQETIHRERREKIIQCDNSNLNHKYEKFQCCVAMVAGKGCVPLYILCPNIVHLFEPHHFNQFVSFVTNRGNHVPHTKQFISSLRRQYLIFEKPLALCRQTGRRLYLPQF